MKTKIKEFQEILSKKNIECALFLNFDENKRDKTIFYFTGVDPEFGALIIPKKEEPKLIIASLEEEFSRKESKIKVILLGKDFFIQLKKILKNVKTLGINFRIFTLNEKKLIKKHLKNVKLIDISKEITEIRAEKTEEEIKKIKKTCEITDKIFSKIISNFNFKNEKDILEFIEKEAKNNQTKLAFPPIIASGKNSSIPHYEKDNDKIEKGFLVMDFGVNYKGYNSDITRTIYIGNPSQKERYDYYSLLGVQEEAIRQIKAGVDFRKIDNNIRKVLGKEFIHSLGHGLGIDVHERLTINLKKTILKENMVLTIEPGIYYKNKYGIRIEDDILVKKNGCEILTKSKKELIIIKSLK